MSSAAGVKQAVAGGDALADPAIRGPRTRRGAGGEDVCEGGVAGHPVAAAAQGSRQRTRDAQPVQRQHRTHPRLDPENLGIVTRVGHRENSAAIRQHQQIGVDDRDGDRSVHRGASLAAPRKQGHSLP